MSVACDTTAHMRLPRSQHDLEVMPCSHGFLLVGIKGLQATRDPILPVSALLCLFVRHILLMLRVLQNTVRLSCSGSCRA